jgi:hypothetical protein
VHHGAKTLSHRRISLLARLLVRTEAFSRDSSYVVFWVIAPNSLAGGYQHTGGIYHYALKM